MKTFNLKVLTPEKVFYEGESNSVVVPLIDGLYGVEALHENVIAALVPGVVKIVTPNSDTIYGVCSNGILKVDFECVYILVDSIEKPEDIDMVRARVALQKAEEEKKYIENRRDYFVAEAEVKRAMNRLKSGRKYKK